MKTWIIISLLLITLIASGICVELWRCEDRSDVPYDSFVFTHAFESKALKEFVELWSDADKASMVFDRNTYQPSEYVTFHTELSVRDGEDRILRFISDRGSQIIGSETNESTGWRHHEFLSQGIPGDDSAQVGIVESNGTTHVYLAVYCFNRV